MSAKNNNNVVSTTQSTLAGIGRKLGRVVRSKPQEVGMVAMIALAASATVHASSYSTDFNATPTGQVPGGPDTRLPGGSDWYTPDNAATFGEFRNGIGLGGTRGLVVGNRGNGFDGVINNVISPRLSSIAGESTAPVNATFDTFTSEYWFRTGSTVAVPNYRFRSETWGTDRTTFFGVSADGDGNLNAFSSSIQYVGPGVNDYGFVAAPIVSSLNWGDWYRLNTEVKFVDGGVANDVVTHRLFNAVGTELGSSTATTWEAGARLFGYNGGQVFGVDAVGFQSRFSPSGLTGETFIDNFSVAIPEPTTLSLIAGAGLMALRRRRA